MNEHKPFTGLGRSPLNAVAEFDVFLFAFFEQVGSGGHTNPHGHPNFFLLGDLLEVQD